MSLVAFGINHKTAPLAVRERLVFQSSRLPDALTTLKGQTAANEAVLLSTCNRTELYADQGSAQQFVQWLASQSGVAPADVQNNGYFYHECAALRHLLRVSSGLDSMVLGEPQIFGQLKAAYFQSEQAGGVLQQFRALFPHVFQVTKQIRKQTNIGRNPITLGYAVMHLAKQYFSALKNTRVLLVGTGEMTELMLSYFERHEMRQIYVASRHIDKASALLKNKHGYPIRMVAIPDYLKHVDLVISATSSQLPIIGKGMVERMGAGQKNRQKVFIDLAVPRDIEPEVGQLPCAELFNLDDLQHIIDANLHSRSLAAEQAELMIMDQAQAFYKKQQVTGVSHAIRQLRGSVEQFRDQELKEGLKLLEQGRDPKRVLSILARGLTNKMLHLPTVKLRQAAYDGNMELLQSVKELFEIE